MANKQPPQALLAAKTVGRAYLQHAWKPTSGGSLLPSQHTAGLVHPAPQQPTLFPVHSVVQTSSVSGPHHTTTAGAAAAAAARSGGATNPAMAAPGAAAGSQPPTWCAEVTLLQADLTDPALAAPDGWGSLQGVDMVGCLEVLEHLNTQDQVQALTDNILGGLQPSCAVFTTPNWEYNAVLRALPTHVAWQGPPGRDGHPLRHPDHKFEWDRSEFSAWAQAAAAAHGYSVEIRGVGRAVFEAEAAGALQGEGGVEARGCATQVAIFTRTAAAPAAPAAAAAIAGVSDTAPASEAAAAAEGMGVAGGTVVWGPKRVTLQVGSLTGPQEAPAGADVAPEAMQVEQF
jgi:hypothetical protein